MSAALVVVFIRTTRIIYSICYDYDVYSVSFLYFLIF